MNSRIVFPERPKFNKIIIIGAIGYVSVIKCGWRLIFKVKDRSRCGCIVFPRSTWTFLHWQQRNWKIKCWPESSQDMMGRKEKPADQLGVIDSMIPENLKLGDWNVFNALWVSSPPVNGVLPGIIVILLVSGQSFSGQAT